MGTRPLAKIVVTLVATAALGGAFAATAGADAAHRSGPTKSEVRFATFNASLNRASAGELISNLSAPYDGSDPNSSIVARRRWQAANVAEVIQRNRPDVVLINEFDFDPGGRALAGFRQNYLAVSYNGSTPIAYPYSYSAESNTGIPSGFDLDNSGTIGGGNDAFGFGAYPGQFGFVVLSMYPIDLAGVRTFQKFLWKDMPGNLIPPGFYSAAELDILRLSSKSHWDLPIVVGTSTVHFLVSHPTPPVFDGPEDRNGRRNHDEIRLWADYVHPARGAYIYDDAGRVGGLAASARFVIAGDQNADPFDGDSTEDAIDQLLHHPKIEAVAPTSAGGPEAAALQGGANAAHTGDPARDTADFADAAPGNLRADYVLPSKRLKVIGTGIFWPVQSDPLSRLTGVFNFAQFLQDQNGFPTSDHRLVWLDVRVN